MKILLYISLLLGIALLPTEATDVGELIPVEVIAVSEERGIIYVETDTGDKGQGNTLEEAFGDMELTSPGIIYLDTAEYLLIEEGMEKHLNRLRPYLKESVRVCKAARGIPLEGIAKYLSIHKPDSRLNEVMDISEIPVVVEENGRYEIKEK